MCASKLSLAMESWRLEFPFSIVSPNGSVNLIRHIYHDLDYQALLIGFSEVSDDAKEYPIVSLFLGNNRIEDDAIDLVTYGVSECKTTQSAFSRLQLYIWQRYSEFMGTQNGPST